MTTKFTPEMKDGEEVLIFHRGKWRHVKFSEGVGGWMLAYGGAMVRDAELRRDYAQLPEKPANCDAFCDWRD